MQLDMRKLVKLAGANSGVSINPESVPDNIWQLWRQQGQCVGQLVSLVLQYEQSPDSFKVPGP